MSRRLVFLALSLFLAACAGNQEATIAGLHNSQIEIKALPIEGGLDKAMAGYRRFLVETPSSTLSPEAIRRLADLKVEKEYGIIDDIDGSDRPSETGSPAHADAPQEGLSLPVVDDLEKVGAVEAVGLYRKLLNDYPLYAHKDRVLYQLSRAYEELGRIEEAMEVMNRLVVEHPDSGYIDEVQFRRGEYYFTHRRYLDAEDAYKSIADGNADSSYYRLALYKLGWALFKQELYEASLQRFIALLDYQVSTGYDFAQTADEIERNRMNDAFRAISLTLASLGGADAAVSYFNANGKRVFEDDIYSNLAEYYYNKRRYSDAVATYTAFVNRNPFHHKAPLFQIRVIDIYLAGGFPSQVIDAKKVFASAYGVQKEYWDHNDPGSRQEVLDFLKDNLADLANHYHALYRNTRQVKEKTSHFTAALRWYREFLEAFPQESESPSIHYQLADLLMENLDFEQAAVEYSKTAYNYPPHEKAATAGYATVYAYRQYLTTVAADDQLPVRHKVIDASLVFSKTFPGHEQAAVVLGAAADDLYDMGEFEQAQTVGQQLVDRFADAETQILRDAWLIVAHSGFKLELFSAAEAAYVQVLTLLPEQERADVALIDNLAASIYKQGEQARGLNDDRTAVNHFLRVTEMAPASRFRPTAEYDAAAALIRLEDWEQALAVLLLFRQNFPGHELQPEVTKKVAYVYRQSGQPALAAPEFERIEQETQEVELRREALQIAAELYRNTGDSDNALKVYRRYVDYFPQPVETNLETRDEIARILATLNMQSAYLAELRQIVAIEAAAERTDRTRYLAGSAALSLAEVGYQSFVEVELVKPFKQNLAKKQRLMKRSTKEFTRLLDYEVGEITAAATFYLAEIYADLSNALMASERPDNLTPLELEQYELALEDQAYPFEEKAIAVHQSNLELIAIGSYNSWVDRSLKKLAKFIPARYDRPEKQSGVMTSLTGYRYTPQDDKLSGIDAAAVATPVSNVEEDLVTEPVDTESMTTEPTADKGEQP